MTTVATDRRYGVSSTLGCKASCLAVTTTNNALSGLQTINGYTTLVGDRVLVTGQTDQTTNGVYQAQTGNWIRDLDFDDNLDVAQGVIVPVYNSGGTTLYLLTTANPITIGASNLTFVSVFSLSNTIVSPTISSPTVTGGTFSGITVTGGSSWQGGTMTGITLASTTTNTGNISGGTVSPQTLAASSGLTASSGAFTNGLSANSITLSSAFTAAELIANSTLGVMSAGPVNRTDGGSYSHGAAGYQKLMNDVILQWGTISGIGVAAGVGNNQVLTASTFSISFPNAVVAVQLTPTNGTVAAGLNATPNSSGFTGLVTNIAASSQTVGLTWLAVGY